MRTTKIVVFSDLHGREDRARELISRHRDADAVLFLGDGLRDLPDEGGIAAVRGNCDFFGEGIPNERMLRFGEYTVMMMHGHTHSVKSGRARAIRYASERGANVLLYGHTHLPEEVYLPEGTEIDGYVLPRAMWVMNPGSLGEPRDGKPSFGLLQIRNGQILLSHGTM